MCLGMIAFIQPMLLNWTSSMTQLPDTLQHGTTKLEIGIGKNFHHEALHPSREVGSKSPAKPVFLKLSNFMKCELQLKIS